eukprot:6014631-Pleurochrysis_carterae.AAC.1
MFMPSPRPRSRMSTPIATSARAMLLSAPRRNFPRRTRHRRCEDARSIGFAVDSGCTWYIQPHVSDFVSVRPCTHRVAGIDGRPRCVAINDLPLIVIDDSGP